MEDLKSKLFNLKNERCKNTTRMSRDSLTSNLVKQYNFTNRCYFKIAEINKLVNLTSNVTSFVDLCAGPGGFSEYLLDDNWKRYGYAFEHESLPIRKRYRGNLKIFTGDLLNENDFETFIKEMGQCVDLVVADGAVSCVGNENKQEDINSKILYAETKMAFRCLKKGGTFMVKIFDTFTYNTKEMIREICEEFGEINVCKPMSSNMFNSEKYIVAKKFKMGSMKNFEDFYDDLTMTFAKKQYENLKQKDFFYTNEEVYRYWQYLGVNIVNIKLPKELIVFQMEKVNGKQHQVVQMEKNSKLGFVYTKNDGCVYFNYTTVSSLNVKLKTFQKLQFTVCLSDMYGRLPPNSVLFSHTKHDKFYYLDVSFLNGKSYLNDSFVNRMTLLSDFVLFSKLKENDVQVTDGVNVAFLSVGTFEMSTFVFV